jgi:hypothetical protein
LSASRNGGGGGVLNANDMGDALFAGDLAVGDAILRSLAGSSAEMSMDLGIGSVKCNGVCGLGEGSETLSSSDNDNSMADAEAIAGPAASKPAAVKDLAESALPAWRFEDLAAATVPDMVFDPFAVAIPAFDSARLVASAKKSIC